MPGPTHESIMDGDATTPGFKHELARKSTHNARDGCYHAGLRAPGFEHESTRESTHKSTRESMREYTTKRVPPRRAPSTSQRTKTRCARDAATPGFKHETTHDDTMPGLKHESTHECTMKGMQPCRASSARQHAKTFKGAPPRRASSTSQRPKTPGARPLFVYNSFTISFISGGATVCLKA